MFSYIKNMYLAVLEFFSKKDPVILPAQDVIVGDVPTEHPIPVADVNGDVDFNPTLPNYPNKYAFIDAHTTRQPGATNYLGESENPWSRRVNRKAVAKLADLGYGNYVFIISRPHNKNYSGQCRFVAGQCKVMHITHANSTHFNAASRGAQGCEFLIPITPYKSDNKMADFASDLLNERFGIRERKADGVFEVDSGHAGAGMLEALENVEVSAMISEPVFANYKTKESQAIFENEDEYVDVLVETAIKAIKGDFDK